MQTTPSPGAKSAPLLWSGSISSHHRSCRHCLKSICLAFLARCDSERILVRVPRITGDLLAFHPAEPSSVL